MFYSYRTADKLDHSQSVVITEENIDAMIWVAESALSSWFDKKHELSAEDLTTFFTKEFEHIGMLTNM